MTNKKNIIDIIYYPELFFCIKNISFEKFNHDINSFLKAIWHYHCKNPTNENLSSNLFRFRLYVKGKFLLQKNHEKIAFISTKVAVKFFTDFIASTKSKQNANLTLCAGFLDFCTKKVVTSKKRPSLLICLGFLYFFFLNIR